MENNIRFDEMAMMIDWVLNRQSDLRGYDGSDISPEMQKELSALAKGKYADNPQKRTIIYQSLLEDKSLIKFLADEIKRAEPRKKTEKSQ